MTCKLLGPLFIGQLTYGSRRYVHLGFRAPKELLARDRLRAIWAIERVRHPLLSARIVTGSDVGIVEYEYDRPGSAKDALEKAGEELDVKESTKEGTSNN